SLHIVGVLKRASYGIDDCRRLHEIARTKPLTQRIRDGIVFDSSWILSVFLSTRLPDRRRHGSAAERVHNHVAISRIDPHVYVFDCENTAGLVTYYLVRSLEAEFENVRNGRRLLRGELGPLGLQPLAGYDKLSVLEFVACKLREKFSDFH